MNTLWAQTARIALDAYDLFIIQPKK